MRIQASNIALVRLGSIGDVVNTLPLLNRLRAGYPQSCITWIVEQKSAPILEGHSALDRVLVFPRSKPGLWATFVRQLREARFDLILDCQRMIRSGILVGLSGARHRIGFDRARCREGNWIFTNRRIPPNSSQGVMLERFLEFADYLELPATEVSWNIQIGDVERDKISRIQGMGSSFPIVISLGASKPEKLWPQEYFVELIRRLKLHWRGLVALVGGIRDRERANRISQYGYAVNTCGSLSLKELAAFLEKAALVVSCDTGPLHLAVAMGAPVIGLYGPSDPARTGPYGQREWIIEGRGTFQCRSCKRWCGNPVTPCMRNISPDTVFEMIQRRLGSHPSWIP